MAVEVDVVEQRAHRLRCVRIASPEVLLCDGDPEVLRDGHVRQERGMLMDDRDPQLLGQRRCQVLDRSAIEDDRPLVRSRRAGGDVHQRRLAGAVLSQQRMDFSGKDVERDIPQRHDGVEVLGDPDHGQRRV
jgi:hypothetical protein